MLRNNLIVRADANSQIGTGHVMRCLALAQAWQDAGGQPLFVMAETAPALETRLQAEGMQVVLCSAEPSSTDDANLTIAKARRMDADLVVVDGYHFNTEYQQVIKDSGLRLLYIDDYGQADHYYADFVLNQNIYADEGLYPHRALATQLLLGNRYALLRREFSRCREWRREIPPVARKVLVTLGGGDPNNVTLKVIKALQQTDTAHLQIRVVIGPANQYLETLQRATAHSTNVQLLADVTDMPELMTWADVAVAAGGSTCWELAFMGLPSVIIVLADNQAANAQGLAEAGVVVNLGWHEQVSAESIAAEIDKLLRSSKLRRQMTRRGRELVDGDGSQRVILALEKRTITIRAITGDDCRLAWEWANEPDARGHSFSPEPIPWKQHVKWFETKLHDPQCLYYIALDSGGEPIGQVRYDLKEEEAVISVTLDAKARGNGYGSLIIQQASNKVFDLAPVNVIHAFIKQDNKASIRAFAKAGYKEKSTALVQGHDALHFILTKILK